MMGIRVQKYLIQPHPPCDDVKLKFNAYRDKREQNKILNGRNTVAHLIELSK